MILQDPVRVVSKDYPSPRLSCQEIKMGRILNSKIPEKDEPERNN
jgi:hypothetical protein